MITNVKDQTDYILKEDSEYPKTCFYYHMNSLGGVQGSSVTRFEYMFMKHLPWIVELEKGVLVEKKYLVSFLRFNGYRHQAEH